MASENFRRHTSFTTGPMVRTRSNKVFKYRRMTFWAERGLIRVIDEGDGDYKTVSIREFLVRAKSFNDSVKRMTKWADEKKELQDMVDDMVRCCKLAKTQGDPFQPGVMRQVKDSLGTRNALIDKKLFLPS